MSKRPSNPCENDRQTKKQKTEEVFELEREEGELEEGAVVDHMENPNAVEDYLEEGQTELPNPYQYLAHYFQDPHKP